MLSDGHIRELRQLNRADKLRAMQVLVTELAMDEEVNLIRGAKYELFTLYGNEAVAQVLLEFLEFDVCFYRSQSLFDVNPKTSA